MTNTQHLLRSIHSCPHDFKLCNKLVYSWFVFVRYVYQGFFKENIRYLAWICRDPISLILGTR